MIEGQKPAEERAREEEDQIEDGDTHGDEVLALRGTAADGDGSNDGNQHVHKEQDPSVWCVCVCVCVCIDYSQRTSSHYAKQQRAATVSKKLEPEFHHHSSNCYVT